MAPNLVKDLEPGAPDQVWVSGITYIGTLEERKLSTDSSPHPMGQAAEVKEIAIKADDGLVQLNCRTFRLSVTR